MEIRFVKSLIDNQKYAVINSGAVPAGYTGFDEIESVF